MQNFLSAPAARKQMCLASWQTFQHHAILHDRELIGPQRLTTVSNLKSEVQALEEKVAELEAQLANDVPNDPRAHGFDERPLHSLDATRFVGPESGIK